MHCAFAIVEMSGCTSYCAIVIYYVSCKTFGSWYIHYSISTPKNKIDAIVNNMSNVVKIYQKKVA